MLVRAYKHGQLMEESESRVQMSVYLHTPADAVARRMLDCPQTYRRWEREHDHLMHTVSDRGRPAEQISALRSAVFGLVHRRAVFEYLRKGQVTGPRRRRVMALFYGCRDYTNALLHEHGNYVRCSSTSSGTPSTSAPTAIPSSPRRMRRERRSCRSTH